MAFLNDIKRGCIDGWQTHQILPSVSAAQAILESAWGGSRLSLPPYNNLFGIKASSDWTGRTVNLPTREYGSSGSYMINADFRAYDSWGDSIKDHAAFFSNTEWRRNNYRAVVGERDYKLACRALQSAGYATDPNYATSLIRLIEQYNLQAWDKEALSPSTPVPQPQPIPPTQQSGIKSSVDKTVGGTITSASRDYAKNLNVSFIGDSNGASTLAHLQGKFASLTYEVQANINAVQAVRSLRSRGQLKEYVVIAVGTDKVLKRNEVDEIIETCGQERKVLFVDTGAEVSHKALVSVECYVATNRHLNGYHANWMQSTQAFVTAYYIQEGNTRIRLSAEGALKQAEFIITALYETATGDFTSRVGTKSNKQYWGIEDIEYKEDDLYSPKGESAIYNHKANQKWGTRFAGKTLWLESLYEDTTSTNPGYLMTEALKVMKANSEPNAQYTVQLSELPDTISIGDSGIFIDHEYNPPLYIKARVLEISTSDTVDSNNVAVIGNVEEVFAQPKPEIIELQRQVKDIRANMLEEYRKGEPINVEMTFTNSLVFDKETDQTILALKVTQAGIDITDRFSKFEWERYSNNKEKDITFNQLLANTQQSSVLTVYYLDVADKASTFICRVYDADNKLIGNAAAKITIAEKAKSAYEIALDNGFVGSESEWIASLKGRDGEKGESIKGADGKSAYLHTAWANSPLGDGFSTSVSTGKTYIGTYTDSTQEDSQDYTQYKWVKIKGEDGAKGAQGIPGQKGADGRTSYLHIAYADNETGTVGFSLNSSTNKKYMGSYSDFNAQSSTSPSRYKWIKLAEAYAQEFRTELDAKAKALDLDSVQTVLSEHIAKLQSLSTTIETTKNNALITHADEYVKTIEKMVGDARDLERRVRLVEQTREEVQTYFQFDDALTIGKSNSKSKLKLDNDEIQFLDGETKGTYLTGNTMTTQNLRVQNGFELGNHKMEKVSNKTVFRYIGG